MGQRQSGMNSVCNGKYQFHMEHVVGCGTFGTVYRGKGARKIGEVAVKQCVVQKDQQQDLEMFKEVKIIKTLQHPNIIKLLDCDKKGGAYYLVTEYCNEGTMPQYLNKHKPGVDEMLPIMDQCCSAVAFLHEQEPPVVHRDIKPDNVLFHRSRKNAPVVCKLADFGLARAVDGTHADTSKAGTAAFMPPELFGPAERAKARKPGDTFALGLVFQTMLEFKPANAKMIPMTEHIGWIDPVGKQLWDAMNANQDPPRVVVHTPSDGPIPAAIKHLIERMTCPVEASRMPMTDVKSNMKRITENKNNRAELQELCDELSSESSRAGQMLRSMVASSGYSSAVSAMSSSSSSSSSDEEDEEGYAVMRDLMGSSIPLIAALMGMMADTTRGQQFNDGEVVRLTDDREKAMALQFRHGGWTDEIADYLGKDGVVKNCSDGKVQVEFQDGQKWMVNALLLSKKTSKDDKAKRKVEERFKENDLVRIKVSWEELQVMQRGHGGSDARLEQCLDIRGLVHRTDGDGDVMVEFLDNTKFFLNPDALEVVDLSDFPLESGDLVLIEPSADEILRSNWNPEMAECLGHTGIVQRADPDRGLVKVETGSATWSWDKKCLKLVAKSDELIQMIMVKQLQAIFN